MEYSLVSSIECVAFIGGRYMSGEASNECQIYRLTDLKTRRFQDVELKVARINPTACFSKEDHRKLFVYGGSD